VTPLPPALGGTGGVVVWRLDREKHAPTWSSGEGAFRAGGRWNSKGVYAVYCSLDPATAILEVAVHKGFDLLDTQPHRLSEILIEDLTDALIVQPADVPNPSWLHPGSGSRGQKLYGDSLLANYPIVIIPSAVSSQSWNVLLTSAAATTSCRLLSQDRFALDTRLATPP
jgi:RES domain-containing protein